MQVIGEDSISNSFIVTMRRVEFDAIRELSSSLNNRPRGSEVGTAMSLDELAKVESDVFQFIRDMASAIEHSKLGEPQGEQKERAVTITRVIKVKV